MPPPRLALPLLLLLVLAACGRGTPLRFPVLHADAGVDAGTPCIPGHVTLTRARPTVLLVIDRSGSMTDDFGTTTRWDALITALSQALPSVDQTTAIGAYLFPSGRLVSSCAVRTGADLLPALGNVGPLIRLLRTDGPLGGTPTADALVQASAALEGIRAARSARALVLATDGAPGCNPNLNPLTCVCTVRDGCVGSAANCLDDVRTLGRLRNITATGLPTYVIGIRNLDTSNADDALFVDVLNRMADAGGKARSSSPRFYPAGSQAELEQALVQIRNQVGSCTFLTASVPDALGDIRVLLDGVVVPEDGAAGWTWADRDNGELVFSGAACTRAAQGAAVTADVGCSDTP